MYKEWLWRRSPRCTVAQLRTNTYNKNNFRYNSPKAITHTSRRDTATPDHVETRIREGMAPGLSKICEYPRHAHHIRFSSPSTITVSSRANRPSENDSNSTSTFAWLRSPTQPFAARLQRRPATLFAQPRARRPGAHLPDHERRPAETTRRASRLPAPASAAATAAGSYLVGSQRPSAPNSSGIPTASSLFSGVAAPSPPGRRTAARPSPPRTRHRPRRHQHIPARPARCPVFAEADSAGA